jgi:hypothetical protein
LLANHVVFERYEAIFNIEEIHEYIFYAKNLMPVFTKDAAEEL